MFDGIDYRVWIGLWILFFMALWFAKYAADRMEEKWKEAMKYDDKLRAEELTEKHKEG